MRGIYGEKHLARVQTRIRAGGDHLVEITSASGARWRRALEREGRALSHFDARSLGFDKKIDDAGRPNIPSENKTMRAAFLQGFHQKTMNLFG